MFAGHWTCKQKPSWNWAQESQEVSLVALTNTFLPTLTHYEKKKIPKAPKPKIQDSVLGFSSFCPWKSQGGSMVSQESSQAQMGWLKLLGTGPGRTHH